MKVFKFKVEMCEIKLKMSEENFVKNNIIDFWRYLREFIFDYVKNKEFGCEEITLDILKHIREKFENVSSIETEIMLGEIGYFEKWKIINKSVCYDFDR